MKKILIPLSSVFLLLLAACQPAEIVVDSPQPNQTIASPVQVEGEVAGNWSFEAFFSARVEDTNGNLLGEAPLQLQGDWMTSDLVPFEGEIPFTKGNATQGKIIFEKANPSGLPENGGSHTVMVNFL